MGTAASAPEDGDSDDERKRIIEWAAADRLADEAKAAEAGSFSRLKMMLGRQFVDDDSDENDDAADDDDDEEEEDDEDEEDEEEPFFTGESANRWPASGIACVSIPVTCWVNEGAVSNLVLILLSNVAEYEFKSFSSAISTIFLAATFFKCSRNIAT